MSKLPRKTFYFIRHGRTHANEQGLMCGGDWDVPLSEEGFKQAREISPEMKKLSPAPTQVFVSPMLRAQQTAEILNKELQLSKSSLEGLREWCVGEWEKLPWGDVPNPFGSNIDPPKGESRLIFEARVELALIEALNTTELPMLVAHGGVAHALFTILGVDPILIDNCSVYRVSPGEKGWDLERVTAPVSAAGHQKQVFLFLHDPQWAGHFEKESRLLSDLLGDNLVAMHHIGSTAIPGIVSKPVIDMMPELKSFAVLEARKSELEKAGYEYRGEHGIKDRRYLVASRRIANVHRIQVHCFEQGHPEVKRHIAFRDYLRSNRPIAAKYEELKKTLAAKYRDERQKYQEGKSAFIEGVLREAGH
jgi:GrpB-like predicted nucleotidyltransferase (UPF0157 family)